MASVMSFHYLFSSLPLSAFLHIFCFSSVTPETLGLTQESLHPLASQFIFMPLTPKKWSPPFEDLASVLTYPLFLSRGGSKIANSKSQCHKLAPGNYILIGNKLIFYILICSKNITLQVNSKLDKLFCISKEKQPRIEIN